MLDIGSDNDSDSITEGSNGSELEDNVLYHILELTATNLLVNNS